MTEALIYKLIVCKKKKKKRRKEKKRKKQTKQKRKGAKRKRTYVFLLECRQAFVTGQTCRK
jgi:hypothetical protein